MLSEEAEAQPHPPPFAFFFQQVAESAELTLHVRSNAEHPIYVAFFQVEQLANWQRSTLPTCVFLVDSMGCQLKLKPKR